MTRLARYKSIIIIVLVGLFIRFLLMALTVHYDLLCSVWRSSLYIFDGTFKIPYFSELNIMAYIWMLKPLLIHIPDALMLSAQHTFSILPDSINYTTFLNYPNIFRYLFTIKSLYLFLDLVLLYIITKYFKKDRLTLILFWATNPFLIYSTYMWGRYEIFPIIFMLLSWLTAKQASTVNKQYWSIFLLGLAMAYRISFIIFIPFILIYFYQNKRHLLGQLITALLPYVVITKLIAIAGGGKAINEYVEIMFTGQLGTSFASISLFLVAFCLLIFLAIKYKLNQNFTYNRFVFVSGLSILSYFAFATFYPQYFAWITPIAILFISLEKKTLPLFWLLFLTCFLLADAYFGCFSSVCLIGNALNPSFSTTYQSFTTQILELINNQTLFVILHSIMISIIAVIAIMVKPKSDEN